MSVAREVLKNISKMALSSDRLFRQLCGKQLAVFMFHDVSDEPSQFSARYHLNITPSVFDAQLKLIKKYFRVISPHQLEEDFDIKEPLALITFDDGLPGYFKTAIPILNANGCPSVIFLNMEPVLGGIFWSGLVTYICDVDPEFRLWLETENPGLREMHFLTASREIIARYLASRPDPKNYLKEVSDFHGGFTDLGMLAEASRNKAVYFGSHLFNHYNAVNLTESELTEAFQKNDEALRRYPNFVPLFSYPFGQPESCFNSRTHELLLKLGASRLFDSVQLFNRSPESKLLHRINMTYDVIDEATFKRRILVPTWRTAIGMGKIETYLRIHAG